MAKLSGKLISFSTRFQAFFMFFFVYSCLVHPVIIPMVANRVGLALRNQGFGFLVSAVTTVVSKFGFLVSVSGSMLAPLSGPFLNICQWVYFVTLFVSIFKMLTLDPGEPKVLEGLHLKRRDPLNKPPAQFRGVLERAIAAVFYFFLYFFFTFSVFMPLKHEWHSGRLTTTVNYWLSKFPVGFLVRMTFSVLFLPLFTFGVWLYFRSAAQPAPAQVNPPVPADQIPPAEEEFHYDHKDYDHKDYAYLAEITSDVEEADNQQCVQ